MDTYFSGARTNSLIDELRPLGAYEFAESGSFLYNESIEVDVSDSLILNIFNSDGVIESKACISLGKPVIFFPHQVSAPYSFVNVGDANSVLWLTYDLETFMALDHAGVQCAYLIPNRVIKTNQDIFKGIADSINNVAGIGIFDDIRLIVNVNEVDKANELTSETAAAIYFLNEPMRAEFEPEYVLELLDNSHDATNKKQVEKDIYDAWKIRPLGLKQKQLEKLKDDNDKRFVAAQIAYSLALIMQQQCPAFYSMTDISKAIKHHMVHSKTIDSIMRKISYMINARKNEALKAVRAENWGKHNYMQVDSLEGISFDTDVVLVTAPTGAGKTKHIITPFRDTAKNNDERFLTVAPLRTLIHELAHKLNTDHYEKIKTRAQAELSEAMAVCLPSIKSMPLKPFIDSATYLAVDEISQNLRYTAVGKITVKGADHEGVFMQLKELVASCKKVVAADASIDDMTLRFFEEARPNERFTIVEQLPKDTGRQCHIYEDIGDLMGKIEMELRVGGNVWISVESADRAIALENFFKSRMYEKYECMMICGENSDDKKRKEFTANIEQESRKYRVVIASPSISSGVSVEHQGNPHFTMIAGIASGHNIAPTDFMQMLARVRYVPDYHVCLLGNNEKNNRLTVNSIVMGQKRAAEMEGKDIKENDFTRFKAQVIIDNTVYRSDFANGFYWIMEYYKFHIHRHLKTLDYDHHKANLKEAAAEIKNEKMIALMSSPPFSSNEEADALENKPDKTQADRYRLEAHKIRKILSLGLSASLTPDDIDMAQNIKKLVRFMRWKKHVPKTDDSDKNIALRKFDHAQVEAYEMLFGDIDLTSEQFKKDNAEKIIECVIENRFLFVALGIVPKKYGAWVENKKTKELLPFKKPAYPVRELNSILEMMGLKTKKREGTNDEYYQVTPASMETMQHYYRLKSA